MRLLLDTQLLLWSARWSVSSPGRMSIEAVRLVADPANEILFSVASIWEVAIKSGLGRGDFEFVPHLVRRGLLDNGYHELAISGAHALAVSGLPRLHKDPFDRILVAQATVEGVTLLTADARVASYPGPIRKV